MSFALALMMAAALFRVVGATNTDFVNFAPMMALAFCGALYLKRPWNIVAPLLAVLISDLFLNRYYGVALFSAAMLPLYLCYAGAFGLGLWVSKRKSWGRMFGATVAGSILFYVVTNTVSWLGDPLYAQTLAGWGQALTIGHPQFPPTWLFFRNTLASDLLFVGLFASVMEFAALRQGEPSLFGRRRGVRAQQAS